MKNLLIFVALLLILSTTVLAETPNDYESLELEQTIILENKLIQKFSSYDIDYFKVVLKLFPIDDERQTILTESSADSQTTDERTYLYTSPTINEVITTTHTTTVATSALRPKVTSKINFPIDSIPIEVQKYTAFTDSIDSSSLIKRKAQELAQGETDLYLLEYKIAMFVNTYMRYSTELYVSDENRPSSWVYDNKMGACDEYTNLFVSFNRELGIPARFVSGMAYTDSELFDTNWGNHAWAEVYFPEIGWIPFDITYKQFGFIDATHIAMKKSEDGSTSSATFTSRGTGFDFTTEDMAFQTEILQKNNLKGSLIETTLKINEQYVGFGSYNLLMATMKNPTSQYVIEYTNLAKTSGIKYFDAVEQINVYKPNEEKTIYWLLKVDENLQTGYEYNFPITYFSESWEEIETSFNVLENSPYYSKEYMEQFMFEEQFETPQEFELDCHPPEKIMQDEEVSFDCDISSVKELEDSSINICFNGACEDILFENGDTTISLNVKTQKMGVQTEILTIAKDNGREQHYITYSVLDTPKLTIKDIVFTKELNYSDIEVLSFKLSKDSIVEPINVKIILDHKTFSQVWKIPVIESSGNLEMNVEGNDLYPGENELKIILEYEDELENEYYEEYSLETNLVGVTGKQKTWLFFKNLGGVIGKSIKNIFT